jgi:hypothetical protein
MTRDTVLPMTRDMTAPLCGLSYARMVLLGSAEGAEVEVDDLGVVE